MKKTLLIDGYNLMHRIEAFDRQIDKSLEMARDYLVRRIADYGRRKATFDRIIIVFDGASNDGADKRSSQGRISVLFSSFGQSADDLIRRLLPKVTSEGGVTVVSDDNYVTNSARAMGADVLSCVEFTRLITKLRRASAAGGRRGEDHDEKAIDPGLADDISAALKKAWKIK